MPPTPDDGVRASLSSQRHEARLGRQELARRGLFALALFVSAFAVSVVTPYVYSREYFRDGAYIVGIPGSASADADSYEVTAFVLSPMFGLLRAAGISLDRYGVVLDLDMLLTNTAFGIVGFAFVVGTLLAYQLPRRYGWEATRIVAVVVLLGPFVFLISKDIIALVVSGVVLLLARAQRWPIWVTCVVWAGALVGLSQVLRAYYLASAVLIVVGYLWARTPRRVVLLYVGFCLSLFVLYPLLPLDDITAGRAEALADVSGSRINYPVDDSGRFGFMVSRTYAFATLLVPVELGLRSVVYLPYVALQLMITWRTVQLVRERCTGLALLSVHVVLAFTAVGALYEPDFGSYFRHKIGTLLFLLVMMSAAVATRRRPDPDDGASPDEAGPEDAVSLAARRPTAAGRAGPTSSSRRRTAPTRRRSPRPSPR